MMLREVYGRVLRDYREESGLTLRKLARKTGVSLSHIHGIEHGKKDASSEILEDICGGLGLTVLDLLEMAATELGRGTVEEEAA
jgi:transcriptional regulator with XRE-family HTH domain